MLALSHCLRERAGGGSTHVQSERVWRSARHRAVTIATWPRTPCRAARTSGRSVPARVRAAQARSEQTELLVHLREDDLFLPRTNALQQVRSRPLIQLDHAAGRGDLLEDRVLDA